MTVSVLVPSSLIRETPDQRAATLKLGYVARAAAVFRVDRLVVYPDPVGERDAGWADGFVETVLRYATTPPYLRKEVWGARDELAYAGILPPLGVTSQTGSGSNDSGSLRHGIVTEVGPERRVWVNCGLQHPIAVRLPVDREIETGERVTVRILSRRPVRARLTDDPPPGPSVERMDLLTALDACETELSIATSKHGDELTVDRLNALCERIETDGMCVAFGAPKRGLSAILADHPNADDFPSSSVEPGLAPADRFDLWLNAIPRQGTETVRTEEALFAVLACLQLRK